MLPVLVALVAAERFAFTGIRTVLLAFMTSSALGLEVSTARTILTLVLPATYLAGVLGGWYADRMYGPQLSLANGAGTLAVAALLLCVPGRPVFYGGLVFLALGDGTLRVNIPSLLGASYAEDDERRDQGFYWLYFGIALGTVLGPIVFNVIGETVGARWAIASAGGCMFVTLGLLSVVRDRIGGMHRGMLNPGRMRAVPVAATRAPLVLILCALLAWAAYRGQQGLLTLTLLVSTVVFFGLLFRSTDRTAAVRGRLRVIVVLAVVVLVWGSLSTQFNLITTLLPARNMFRIQDVSSFRLLGNVALVVFAPIFGVIWSQLGRRGMATSPLTKSAIGLLLIATSAAVLTRVIPQDTGAVNPLWLGGTNLFLAWAELAVVPIGMSAVTRLAPASLKATTLGIWLFTTVVGNFAGTQATGVYQPWPLPTQFAVIFIFIQAFVAGALVLTVASAEGAAGVQRRRRLLLWGGATPVVAIVMVVWLVANRTAAIEADSSPRTPPFRQDTGRLVDDSMLGFVAIAAGDTVIGTDAATDALASSDEMPAHRVTLPPYLIGRYEVTVDQYQMCVDANVCARPPVTGTASGGALPVRYVTQDNALAYCAWLDSILPGLEQPDAFRQAFAAMQNAHVTLPSEVEWEHAARGVEGQIYPWGPKLEPGFANYRGSGKAAPVPIGLFPRGVSRSGLFDVSGNVAEWTRSDYRSYPYVATDGRETGADPQLAVVIRGGSFYDDTTLLRSTARQAADRRRPYDFVGFRVVIRSGQAVPLPTRGARGATAK